METQHWGDDEPVRVWIYGIAGQVFFVLLLVGYITEAPTHHFFTLTISWFSVILGTEFARQGVKHDHQEAFRRGRVLEQEIQKRRGLRSGVDGGSGAGESRLREQDNRGI